MQSMRCCIGKRLTLAFSSQIQNNREKRKEKNWAYMFSVLFILDFHVSTYLHTNTEKKQPMYMVMFCILSITISGNASEESLSITVSQKSVWKFQRNYSCFTFADSFAWSLITATTSWNYLQRTNFEQKSFLFNRTLSCLFFFFKSAQKKASKISIFAPSR